MAQSCGDSAIAGEPATAFLLLIQGSVSPLRHYEVTNAHHLDTLNQLAGSNALHVPLHRYFNQAMDLMYGHLRQRRALPPSQVVHTTRAAPARHRSPPAMCPRSPMRRRRRR
jgi:hypothetical protein